MSVGLLYVENRTCTLLSEEIVAHLGKDKVITHGIEEKNTTADKLTHTGKLIVKRIGNADSFIVIVDDVHWKTFWNETSNKIPNKLEELLDEDDENDDTASKSHNFILVVGINTNKNEEIKEKEFSKYLGSQSISSKVCHMLKSLDDTTSTVKKFAKEIVEKFTNQLCPNMPKELCFDTKDNGTPNSTPVQTPVVSIDSKWTFPVSTVFSQKMNKFINYILFQ